MSAPRSRPLRAELALTYAGIALLTAVLLGGILLGVLGSYYARAETAFLQSAAARVVDDPLPATSADAQQWVLRAAITAQARVRLYDSAGRQLADSGSLGSLDPDLLSRNGADPGGRGGRGGGHGHGDLPDPLGGGLFSGSSAGSASVSSRTLRIDLPQGAGYVVLSEPPVSGASVLTGIAQAWLVAALLAVALAALAGYLLSRRISRPLAELTAASDRMAEGDLSARAPVPGAAGVGAAVTGADEFTRLAGSFNAMAERNETTVLSLRRFVADAAHEIGTPLTALEADLELAEKAGSPEDARRLVARALEQARRLEALSQGLLRLSRIETGDTVTLEPVDLSALATEAADAIASRAEQAELTLEIGEIAEHLVVVADRTRLRAVLDGLLDNAVKFTEAGGQIAISATRESNSAVITVADNGIGIPLAEQDAVFSRFHRARNVSAIPGSGLGLAIVKATVEQFGGAVGFASDESGTRFEIRLPLAE